MVRSEEELERLLIVVGLDELFVDERFTTPEMRYEHRAALSALIAEKLVLEDSDEWLTRFSERQINVNRVQMVEETVLSEQVIVNEMVVPPVDDGMDLGLIINHPVKIDKVAQVGPKRAPDLGEHSREILEELGYAQDKIQLLFDNGVIADARIEDD